MLGWQGVLLALRTDVRHHGGGRRGAAVADAWAALGARRPVCGGLVARRPRLRAECCGEGAGVGGGCAYAGVVKRLGHMCLWTVVNGFLDEPPNKSQYHSFFLLFLLFSHFMD